MDTKNDSKIPQCGGLPDLSRQQTVAGAKQLRKALQNGRAYHVFLAKNADPAITEPLEALSKASSVPCTWVHSMEALGRACGIEVGTAAAAAVR